MIAHDLIKLGYPKRTVDRWALHRSETLSDRRRAILDALLEGQATAGQLSDRVGIRETAVRWQLDRMEAIGWISQPAGRQGVRRPASITLKGMRVLGYREPGVAG